MTKEKGERRLALRGGIDAARFVNLQGQSFFTELVGAMNPETLLHSGKFSFILQSLVIRSMSLLTLVRANVEGYSSNRGKREE